MTNLGLLLRTAIVLSIIAAALFPASSAMANGAHAGSREVYAGNVGPYFMKVNTAPFVGTLHFIVYVSRAGGPDPVQDAEIRISARRAAGGIPDVGPVLGCGLIGRSKPIHGGPASGGGWRMGFYNTGWAARLEMRRWTSP